MPGIPDALDYRPAAQSINLPSRIGTFYRAVE
jgi:hypothetical protein